MHAIHWKALYWCQIVVWCIFCRQSPLYSTILFNTSPHSSFSGLWSLDEVTTLSRYVPKPYLPRPLLPNLGILGRKFRQPRPLIGASELFPVASSIGASCLKSARYPGNEGPLKQNLFPVFMICTAVV
ncbi:hypothetical protein F5Y17DRAFT_416276 [Xylariaceae sp. FL0594]|nr:hypothetical protein F5Y17DRAFT_416276 [Xylariaceae sp. FL0594]